MVPSVNSQHVMQCRVLAMIIITISPASSFVPPNLSTDNEVAEVMSHIDNLSRWAYEVKDYAADLAVKHGKQWPQDCRRMIHPPLQG